mmetsp:Transcript_1535/g.2933  ORF Transcript_1535/g.2933 Transcript_1535/m.2933 type:complete len:455 (+) Transcript_1535:113-1477(+)
MVRCGADDEGWASFPPSPLPPTIEGVSEGLQKSQQEDDAAQAMTAMNAIATVASATGSAAETFDENNNEHNREKEEEAQGKDSNPSSAEPVGDGTSNKRKRTMFTVSQKLAILKEIDQKTPLESQDSIIQKHGTSKTSVLNWRKNLEEIEKKSNLEESTLSEGNITDTGDEKINETKQDANATNNTESKSASAEESLETSKKKRKRREAYSISEKLAILDEIDQKVLSQEFICKKYGTTRNSVSIWRNNREEYERQVAEDKRGKKKTVLHNDGLRRIKNGLKTFYEFNMTLPPESRIPLSGENHDFLLVIFHLLTSADLHYFTTPGPIVSKRALEIKRLLLADHEEKPFLTQNELKAITTFTGSKGWGRKMAAQFGWKSGPQKSSDAGQEESKESFEEEIKQIQEMFAQFDQEMDDGHNSNCLRLRRVMVNVVSQLSAFSKPADADHKDDSEHK